MSGTDNRSDRDLLIRLETQFANMNENVTKIDRKLDAFDQRLDSVVRDIKDDLKTGYVTKQEFQTLMDSHKILQSDMSTKYTPLSRFTPVEEVHNDVAKRIRTILISVGICVLIAAASAPTWLAIYRSMPTPQGAKG